MVFSSLIFLVIFMPLVIFLHQGGPRGARNAVLLLASIGFYAWGEDVYTLGMVASVLVSWKLALWVEAARTDSARRAWLVLAVALNLGALGVFKYLGFFVETFNALAAPWLAAPVSAPALRLPAGISFYTFQALSYVVDVYRKETPAQRSLRDLALYISLFPQLIAGPIVRYVDVAAQLPERRLLPERFVSGFERFAVGLAKKMLVANPLGAVADSVFGLTDAQLTPSTAWVGLAAYTLQIYFDFSGYSCMAIGLGRMLGFEFVENFAHPYASGSITEFWRRWHISLSTWFRDYLYIPLGGNRAGTFRTGLNLALVFLLCGLWHGASWNFVAWGALHGALLVFERVGGGKWLARLSAALRTAYTLSWVAMGWVLFRTDSLAHAGSWFTTLLTGAAGAAGVGYGWQLYLTPWVATLMLVGAVGASPWPSRWMATWQAAPGGTAARGGMATVGAMCLLLACVAFVTAGTHNPFIYFRF
ncbi:MAG: hypothetical protein RL653_3756 [Pseudomonadota bacterium]|jgi:alginate O-acetyltransferase complex protein AlgI